MRLGREIIGSEVALTRCIAYTDENQCIAVSGLWTVEEFHPCEPAAYVPNDCYSLTQEGEDQATWITVDAYDLFEQVDPQGYGRWLEQCRRIEEANWETYIERVQAEA